MAKRIIAYKRKISEQWLEKKENSQNKDESEDGEDDDGEPPKREMVSTKTNKKQFYKQIRNGFKKLYVKADIIYVYMCIYVYIMFIRACMFGGVHT